MHPQLFRPLSALPTIFDTSRELVEDYIHEILHDLILLCSLISPAVDFDKRRIQSQQEAKAFEIRLPLFAGECFRNKCPRDPTFSDGAQIKGEKGTV
jgi:hypothetical protein